MRRQRTLIFFGAHPDDETFGMGATLALYVLKGAKVYYVCSTRGEEGTIDPELMKGFDSTGDLRWHELECAAKELGLSGIIHLGYRDSGMQGAEQNKHPDALAMAPLEEVTGRMVKIIRELKPDVVLTHDAGGGYGHPDHIATHNAAVKAFYAAGDPAQYPSAGAVFHPHKLYFGVHPFKGMKFLVRMMPLFGQDPHHFGRNKDVDLTRMTGADYPIHAVIRLTRQAGEIRIKAAACHASQGGGRIHGGGPVVFRIAGLFNRRQDYFMREYPPPTRHIEKDLMEGLP